MGSNRETKTRALNLFLIIGRVYVVQQAGNLYVRLRAQSNAPGELELLETLGGRIIERLTSPRLWEHGRREEIGVVMAALIKHSPEERRNLYGTVLKWSREPDARMRQVILKEVKNLVKEQKKWRAL